MTARVGRSYRRDMVSLPRGRHQLRIAALTADTTRRGLLLAEVDVQAPNGDLSLGLPVLLASDAQGVRPTLARSFAAGDPVAFQVELAGPAVRRGSASLRARLLDASGRDAQRRDAALEPQTPGTSQQRATGVIPTDAVPPGAYTLLLEASAGPSMTPLRHAIPLRLEVSTGRLPGTRADAAPATSAAGRLLTPHAVAHGPLTRDARRGAFVIRSSEAWRAFWSQLPTRQAAPDIDFDRVVLLAVISDESPASTVPQIVAVRTEAGGLLVEWTSVPADAPSAVAPTRPFVVVGVTEVAGHVRFEKITRTP